jgi:phosphoketolase
MDHCLRSRNYVNIVVAVKQMLADRLTEHLAYIRRYAEDMPSIRDWRWPALSWAAEAARSVPNASARLSSEGTTG